MSVFVHDHSRVLIQGFTGQHATFHAEEAIKGGTTIVGGVTPGKGGMTHLDLPVFDTVSQAVEETGADVSGIFVPPPFAADAIMEALEAGIRVIVVIADGIPVQDMVRVKRYAAGRKAVIIGPNTPGIITPGACKVGIMPSHIYTPGRIGVVSRSGTLNYEAVQQMTELFRASELQQCTAQKGLSSLRLRSHSFPKRLSLRLVRLRPPLTRQIGQTS